jgi:hypothetical protein
MSYEELKKRHDKMMKRAGSEYASGLLGDEDSYAMDGTEDEFFGVEFDQLERFSTIFKMQKTGIIQDEDCEVKVIEPLGLLPCLVVIENEKETTKD